MTYMNARYLNELEALRQREGNTVEITVMGGPRTFVDTGPTIRDFQAAAERAYIRGDLTVEEFEAQLDTLFGVGGNPK